MLRDWPGIQKYVHLFIPLKTQGPILLFTFFTSSRPLLGKLTNLKSTHRTVLLSLFNIFFSTTLHSSYFLFREWTHKTHSLVAQRVQRLPAMWETWVRSQGREDPLEKEMATHSSILAWRIPWTEEPGRLQSMGLQKIEHD